MPPLSTSTDPREVPQTSVQQGFLRCYMWRMTGKERIVTMRPVRRGKDILDPFRGSSIVGFPDDLAVMHHLVKLAISVRRQAYVEFHLRSNP